MKTDVVKITESLMHKIFVIMLAVIMVLTVTACVPGEEQSQSEEVGVLEQEEAVLVAEETAEATPFLFTIDKDVYMPGETMTVVYTASEGSLGNAFIGIVPVKAEGTTDAPVYLTTHELAGVVNGSLELAAPADPGFYELHLVDGDSIINILPFNVAEAM